MLQHAQDRILAWEQLEEEPPLQPTKVPAATLNKVQEEATASEAGEAAKKDETSRAFGVATEVGLKAVPARILDPLPLVYRDMQGHEAAVHPDTYKGQWNMRSRGADLAMARCCPPLTTWVIISFVRKEMMTDQVHDRTRLEHRAPPACPHAHPHASLTARSSLDRRTRSRWRAPTSA